MKNDLSNVPEASVTVRPTFLQRFATGFFEILPEGRSRRLAFGIASGILTKGTAFLFTLISVPMTLHYLGVERYGIWVTMISIMAWISLVDLGLANGLTTLLSAAIAKNQLDLARRYVSTAFWNLIVIAILAAVAMSMCWQWIDWSSIFNLKDRSLESQISKAMMLAVGIFLISLPLAITQRIYLAYQKGTTANIWQLVGSLAGVLGIYLVTKMQGNLVYLVLGYSGSQLAASLLNSLWLFGKSKPELNPFVLPNFRESKNVMTMGGMFFVNQIATLLVFQKDNILITRYLGPIEATNYSITWQMFFYLNVINILVAPFLGPAFGEAYAKKDSHWMNLVVRRYLLITFSFSLLAVLLLTLFHRSILMAWVGSDVIPNISTVLWMALWTVVLSIQWPIITLLNGAGRLRLFTIIYGLAAMANLFLSVVLIKLVGVSGGLMASVITMGIFVLLPSIRELIITVKGD